LPRSRLGAVPFLVSVFCTTSDNGHYGNLVGRGRTGVTRIPINERILLANPKVLKFVYPTCLLGRQKSLGNFPKKKSS
jgi:hypothetical protein